MKTHFIRLSGLTCLLLLLNGIVLDGPTALHFPNTPEPDITVAPPHGRLSDSVWMWREPVNLESFDLFYGIGGAQGAPDPAGDFSLIRRQGSPTDSSEKFLVQDVRGRQWVVKLGPEARPEVAATRLVWAAGFHVDQDYFVRRAHITGRGGFDIADARFERDDDGFHTEGRWSWKDNPFIGGREFQGLKVLMALLNNWDLSEANNKIVSKQSSASQQTGERLYYVNDLGASLGRSGGWLNRIPLYKDAAGPSSRGDAQAFAGEKFIDGIIDGKVQFHWGRKFGRQVVSGVSVDNAGWMGNLLARLSDKQLADAFRAGGFHETEVQTYTSAIRDRIRQLQNLK